MNASNQKELFKFQLSQQALKSRNKRLKLKKSPGQFPPIKNEKLYNKEIKKILNQFIKVTIEAVKPMLREWNRQNKILVGDDNVKEIKYDDPTDDLNEIDKKWEQLRIELFGKENEDNLNNLLLLIALGVGTHNQKQWQKVLRQTAGIEFILQEAWEEPVVKAWISRNVSLIKGLTDEYRKKIKETILDAFEKGITAEDLAKQLTKINRNFATGRTIIVKGEKIKKQSRSMLIARDQINKLNGIYTRRRQYEAGIDWYIWSTSADERVRGRPGGRYPNARPSHWALENKICKWDNPIVYADTIEDAKKGNWKSRANIGAVQLHPGQDIQCRCSSIPVMNELIEEVNQEIKK